MKASDAKELSAKFAGAWMWCRYADIMDQITARAKHGLTYAYIKEASEDGREIMKRLREDGYECEHWDLINGISNCLVVRWDK
ncbi:MAG: hypothetical protein WC523_03980 [Patescibacteria group bacterium]